MTFDELRQHVRDYVFLSTDLFAEQVRFAPVGLEERTITAKISQRGNVADNQGSTEQLDEIEVLVTRDEDHATLGGIARPQHGDRLYRSTSRDYLGLPYVFEGEVISETPHQWKLLFRRTVRRVQRRGIA